MITTVVTVTSTFLAGTFGAAAVAALILFLIMRELTSAHAEESGSMRSKILSHTLLVPISPLLVVFAFIVAVKVLEVRGGTYLVERLSGLDDGLEPVDRELDLE